MNTIPDPIEDGQGPVPPSDEVRAGEYVLGVLDAGERRDVEARIASDAVFADLVAAWEDRFAPWLSRIHAQAPPAGVWRGVRERLGWEASTTQPGLWHDTAFWRGATGLAVAAGVAAIAIAIGLRQPAPTGPVVAPPVAVTPPATGEAAALPVTVLTRDDGSTGWIATVRAGEGKVHMVPVPSALDASGRVNELWVIPADGVPRSLGFVSNEMAHTIDVPEPLRAQIAVGATLAITLEPEAGIPHAAPTGPVVAQGGIQRI